MISSSCSSCITVVFIETQHKLQYQTIVSLNLGIYVGNAWIEHLKKFLATDGAALLLLISGSIPLYDRYMAKCLWTFLQMIAFSYVLLHSLLTQMYTCTHTACVVPVQKYCQQNRTLWSK